MEILNQVWSFLLPLLIIAAIFYWFGGFELLKFFNRRKLQKQIRQPFEASDIQAKITQLKNGNIGSLNVFETLLISDSLQGNEEWVAPLYKQQSNDTHLGFIYAAFLIKKGWLARGKGAAARVSEESFSVFYNALEEADHILKSILDDAGELTPAVLEKRLIIFKGVSRSEEATDLYINQAASHTSNISLHLARISQMASRWGGDAEHMFSLAKTLSNQGGLMPVMLAAAWIEHAIDEDKKTMKKAMAKTEDKQKLLAAYQSLAKVPAQLSSLDDYSLVMAYNIYAVLFYFLNEKKLAKDALSKTQGYLYEYPWKYVEQDIKTGYYNALIECKVSAFA